MDEKQDFLGRLRGYYPSMFADPNLREIECFEGWEPLIDGLCGVLQTHLNAHPAVKPVVVRRVKEKYGGLKFIFDGGDEFCRQARDVVQEQSLEICELCGMPGELIGTRWFSVRCPAHAEQDRLDALERERRFELDTGQG
jgi:hypothetical protein